MLRVTWHLPALIAVSLWASLIPQVSYTTHSSGDPGRDVLAAWPGWAVQQDVGPITGTIGAFQIWVSAEPDGDVLTVWASLVDASTLEIVRQTSIDVRPGYFPSARHLMFPAYMIPTGQRLLLQLQVADHEHNYILYQLASPGSDLPNVMLNGVRDSGSGSLMFAHTDTGSGVRAALAGESWDLLRLVSGVVLWAMAIVMHPYVLRIVYITILKMQNLSRRCSRHLKLVFGMSANPDKRERRARIRRVLSVPWYPWLAAAIPILHFAMNNSLHFALSEAVVPISVSLVVTTGIVVALRMVFHDWFRSSAVTTVIIVFFFGYGHIKVSIEESVDERLFFAAAVFLTGGAIVLLSRVPSFVACSTQWLNLTTSVLLLFPLSELSVKAVESYRTSSGGSVSTLNSLISNLLPEGIPSVKVHRPDIYYIILDRYARDDALGKYDNSEFIDELRERGFYVATEAISNYNRSILSIPSSLNLAYLDYLGDRSPRSKQDMVRLGHWNSLAAILKSLGYTYVHLESGYIVTGEAPLADLVFTFTPSGPLLKEENGRPKGVYAGHTNLLVSERFSRHVLSTTAAHPILTGALSIGVGSSPYAWWSSHRALQAFEFLSRPVPYPGPTFVFAHILKPHLPATFDQHGNQVSSESYYDTFDDSHDPTVPDAYTGQLIHINTLALKTLDSILQNSDHQAIIVLTSDHGRGDERTDQQHQILAAFHLPGGAEAGLYPSISSVNHFRYILDYYFDLNIGLIEDRVIRHGGNDFDFTRTGGDGS